MTLKQKLLLAVGLLLLPFFAFAGAAAERLTVVTSIHPLAIVAKQVGGEDFDVSALLQAGDSPHNYSLRLSDRKLLMSAHLVIWVGPETERFLADIVDGENSLSMMGSTAENLHVEEQDDRHSGHDHAQELHPWLDPQSVSELAFRLAQRLGELRPDSAQLYAERANKLVAELARMKPELSDNPRRYVVAHNAFEEFVGAFGLPPPLVLSRSSYVATGAKSLAQVSSQVSRGDCVLVEANHYSRIAVALAEQKALKVVTVDVMGFEYAGATYRDFLESLLSPFLQCLY